MSDKSAARARFEASMKLDFDAWKDGIPYEVALLDGMSDFERADIEADLSVKSSLDWRDVEALNRIGTKTAKRRVQRAGYEQTDGAGIAAFKGDLETGWTPAQEIRFIQKLESARHMEGAFDRLFAIADEHPTPRVRDALFRLAAEGHPDVRYACGAFLLYLAGHVPNWYG
ncbi:MAG: hypothetical protein ABI399_13745, partial [Bauldia sp.]